MALPGHHAARGNQNGRTETVLLGAEKSRNNHIAPGFESAVHLQANAPAQTAHHQDLLCFRQSQLPGCSRILDRPARRSARAAVMAAYQDVVGKRFGHARRDGSDSHLRNELHVDARLRVDALQVVDQLRQVLDAVNVVVRRRGYQRDTGERMPQPGDVRRYFNAGYLAPLAGLGALGHLDLELHGRHEILCRNTEPRRSNLFDRAVAASPVTIRVLPAFS